MNGWMDGSLSLQESRAGGGGDEDGEMFWRRVRDAYDEEAELEISGRDES